MSRGLGPSAPPGAPREAGTSKSCLPGLATRGAGGVHLSPWPVEAGRATQLCPEQRNRGGREVRTRRTRPLPAPRKALAAGGAWCGGAWCGVAGRHGPADEEGREAQQGARARAPHANMVSCNHCQAEGGKRGQPGQKPQVRPPSSMAQESPSPHPPEGRWERDPPGEGAGHSLTSSTPGSPGCWLLYRPPGVWPILPRTQTPKRVLAGPRWLALGLALRPQPPAQEGKKTLPLGIFPNRTEDSPTLNKSKVTTPSRSVSRVLKNPVCSRNDDMGLRTQWDLQAGPGPGPTSCLTPTSPQRRKLSHPHSRGAALPAAREPPPEFPPNSVLPGTQPAWTPPPRDPRWGLSWRGKPTGTLTEHGLQPH